MPNTLKKTLADAFRPRPLSIEEIELYVPFDDIRGDANVVRKIVTTISESEVPTYHVLTGQLGSGKTTELIKVRSELETGAGKRLVAYYLPEIGGNGRDFDFPTLLVGLLKQILLRLDDVGIQLNILQNDEGIIQRALRIFSELQISGLSLKVPILELSAALNQPSMDKRT